MENLLIIRFLLKISIFLSSHSKARTSDKFFVSILIQLGNFFSINYLLTIIIENAILIYNRIINNLFIYLNNNKIMNEIL